MNPANPFANLRIAITGGTSGLGLALVHLLHEQGARVAFVARHRERVDEVAREHPGTHGIVADVSVKDDIYPMALQILGELGGLDVLINNASRSRAHAAGPSGRHRVRGSRPCSGDERPRPVPSDEGAARRARGFGAPGTRSRCR